MATSGSTNFSQTRDQICSDTLQLIGVIGEGETASSDNLTFCSNQLNKMIKAWQATGIHLWKESSGTIPVVSGQYLYQLNSSNYPSIGRPLDLINCRYQYSSGLERKMKRLGRGQYDELPTKTTSTGPSTCFYYSPQLTTSLLYVWPVPDNSDDSLVITYVKTIEDFDSASDDADFPQEWLEPITYNLCVRVAPAFGKVLSSSAPEIIAIAQESLQALTMFDSENGSVFIRPERRY